MAIVTMPGARNWDVVAVTNRSTLAEIGDHCQPILGMLLTLRRLGNFHVFWATG
jgi:hypothetical protein